MELQTFVDFLVDNNLRSILTVSGQINSNMLRASQVITYVADYISITRHNPTDRNLDALYEFSSVGFGIDERITAMMKESILAYYVMNDDNVNILNKILRDREYYNNHLTCDRDNYGMVNPLYIIIKNGDTNKYNMISDLIDIRVSGMMLYYAVYFESYDILRRMLEFEPEDGRTQLETIGLDIQDESQLMSYLIQRRHIDIIELFLQAGMQYEGIFTPDYYLASRDFANQFEELYREYLGIDNLAEQLFLDNIAQNTFYENLVRLYNYGIDNKSFTRDSILQEASRNPITRDNFNMFMRKMRQ